MEFFKRKWPELLVASIFFFAVIGLAIATPYLFPVFFAAALHFLVPAAGAATVIWYGLSTLAALFSGVIAGSITSCFRKCCCRGSDSAITPDETPTLFSSGISSGLQPPSYDDGQQPVFLATQFPAAPPPEQVIFVPSANPLQTNQGAVLPGFLQTTTGVFRGWMTQFGFQPEPVQQTMPQFIATATHVAPSPTDGMKPTYTRTNR